jgi:tetratricopeptide (TPR) repeat protein
VAARIPAAESSAQIQSLLADAAEHTGNFKEAVAHYQSAAKLDPSEANLYALGMEFVRHWTFEPATKIFEYGLTRYPESAHLLSGQGIALYANNDYAAAAKIFSGLLEKFPDNSMYAEILGHSCNLMPDASEGCETLVDFATKHPGNASAETYAAAIVLHRTAEARNLDLARTLLEHAIATNAKLPETYFQLGVLEQQQGRWAESKSALEQCLTLTPHLSRAHYRLGLAYSRLGDKDKARAEFELQRKYSQEEKDHVNARLEEVTTFLVSNK